MPKALTTKPRAASCNRCHATVVACTVDGVRVAVDPLNLDKQGMLDVVMRGGSLWRSAGRKLTPVTLHTLKLGTGLSGTILGSHGCGCSAIDTRYFEEAEQNVPKVPAMGDSGARDSTARQWSVVKTANRPRFERKCDNCGEMVKAHEMYALEWRGEVLFAFHVGMCP